MRMIFSEDLARNLGALPRRAIVVKPQLMHSVKNAPMHGLQAIANIGQRAADDDGHRVVEIRPPHLVFDVDGDQVFATVAAA